MDIYFLHCGGWKVQDQGASRFGVWWGPASWFTERDLLAGSSRGRRSEGALWGPFYKDTRSYLWGLHPHDQSTSQKPHLLILSHWALGFNMLAFQKSSQVWGDVWGGPGRETLGRGVARPNLSSGVLGRVEAKTSRLEGKETREENIAKSRWEIKVGSRSAKVGQQPDHKKKFFKLEKCWIGLEVLEEWQVEII